MVPVAESDVAMEKGAGMVVFPVVCQRALVDLSDDVATRVQSLLSLDAEGDEINS
jgi:ATP-dependent Lon protease